ncbi:MAG: lysozyme [Pseudomonadota bacterium]|nr:lysozyme [Pseudomonadota bacterium]
MYMSTAARLSMRNTEKKMLKYYDDGGKGRGNCTWGIGTKAHNGPCSKTELARVVLDADIEREFAVRLREAERGVERHVKASLTQEQFDALVGLAYNAGVPGSSKVFELINSGNFDGAATRISGMVNGHKWIKGKRVPVFYPGLVARRTAEAAPFRNASNAPLRSAEK